MPATADSFRSSSERPLTLRVRPDLTARRHRYQGRISIVVKEPLGLNYFRFKEEEYALLLMFDGRNSLEQLKQQFEREFPPQKISLKEIQQFAASCHQSGLVISSAPGQGRQLEKRRDERQRKERLGRWTNVLAIRFRGIDPEPVLSAIYPFFRWMYSPLAVALCLLLGLAALLLVLVQFDVFLSRLPGFHQFFGASNWVWLFAALAITKVIHEFGHGLTCKHFGGECHEMGVLFLVLTPCLYCNVSDSWMLPSKWRRAAIGAAGMYIEVVMASIATFLWWFSEPSLLNNLCLSTMFVCSVSTLVFNANPLLRYDGYYILSDLLEIPNLRQKSSRILHRKLAWWCLGIEPQPDPFLPQRNQAVFAFYSVAAAAYRWVVVFSILWFLDKVFEPYGLRVIGQMIALAALYGLLVTPMWKVVKFFWVPGRIEKVKKLRVAATLALLTAAVMAVLHVPLPHHVFCPLELRVYNAAPVYVEVPGVLQQVSVRPGDTVAIATGQPAPELARLISLEADVNVTELSGEYLQTHAQLMALSDLRNFRPAVGAQIAPVQESRDAVKEQLEEALRDRQRLILRSPRSGVILPPPAVPPKERAEGQLPSRSGTPFDAKNLGCFLDTGELFCLVGDPSQMEAVLVVDQADVEFVREGQEVEIMLDELPGEPLTGTIEQVSRGDVKVSPRHLSDKAGGELLTKTDPSGVERPQSTSYQARVRLENPHGLLATGLAGRAKIQAGRRTLGARLYRWLSQTFRFRR